MSPPSSVLKSNPSNSSACCLLHVGFLIGLRLNTEEDGDMLTFNGLHGDISQTTERFKAKKS
jgi:hypothetical protein